MIMSNERSGWNVEKIRKKHDKNKFLWQLNTASWKKMFFIFSKFSTFQPDLSLLKCLPLPVSWDGQQAWKKSSKRWKSVWFSVFFIIEQVFLKCIHRKNKKAKPVFASITIPSYVFSKNINTLSLKPQVQCLMKTIDF